MKKCFAIIICAFLSMPLFARNDILFFSIEEAMNTQEVKEKLNPDIKFVFGSGYKGNILVSQVMSNKKASRSGKNDKTSCQRALLNALISLQNRAVKEGGSKVVNITGYYYKNNFDSKTEFQCGAGTIMSGVTLKADIAK